MDFREPQEKMYEELSNETGEFFNFMVNNELMDLVNKRAKETGSYCTFIEDYKAPFISLISTEHLTI